VLKLPLAAIGHRRAAMVVVAGSRGSGAHPSIASSNGSLPVKNFLRELRAERGWSQGDLADRLAVSRQTVNAIETQKYDPSLPLAFKIARLFDKPIEKIFVDGQK
jgi:putative transcriptional regulator